MQNDGGESCIIGWKKFFKEQLKELVENGHYDLHDKQDPSVRLCYVEQLRNIIYKVSTSCLSRLGRQRLTFKKKNVNLRLNLSYH